MLMIQLVCLSEKVPLTIYFAKGNAMFSRENLELVGS